MKNKKMILSIFKTYISYATVQNKVLSELNMTLDEIRENLPDTYDFLMSLKNDRSTMVDYR